MGTIDKKWFKLSCEKCDVTETSSALDKGSNWSGSFWNYPDRFENFDINVSGGDKTEPEIVLAICKACKGNAVVDPAYGHNKPDGY